MSAQRNLLQLALGQLEYHYAHTQNWQTGKAIDALRDALADPAPAPLTDEQIDADWAEACRMHTLTRDLVRAFARTTYARATGGKP
jgi:hypothetical protein